MIRPQLIAAVILMLSLAACAGVAPPCALAPERDGGIGGTGTCTVNAEDIPMPDAIGV